MRNNTSTATGISLALFTVIAVTALWLFMPRGPVEKPGAARKLASSSLKNSFRSRQKQRTEQKISPFSRGKVQLNFRQMKVGSARFAQLNVGKAGADDLWVLPAGSELMAIIDRACTKQPAMVARMKTDSFSYILADRRANRPGLKTQAYGLRLEKDMTVDEIDAAAADDPCLVGIAENGRVSADDLYGDPSAGQQAHLANLQVGETEDFFFQSSATPDQPVILAVVDTGVDYKHVDLSGNMWSDDQGSHGFDFVNDDNDPMDDNFHGTHVAGLAAAVGGNDLGGSGVMPAKVQIMAVKILDDGGNGSYNNVANGIYWAVEKGADLINLSLSGPGQNAGVADALAFAANNGVPVFVSAGNNGSELTDDNFRTPTSYAAQIHGVMAVGAIDAVTSAKSSFSNYGPAVIEISAPGSNGIYSTLPDNSFGEREGTSMSTPIVTGAAALAIGALKAQNYAYTAGEIEEIVGESATANSDLTGYFTDGRQVNVKRLKEYLLKNYLAPFDGGIDEEE